MQTVNTAAPTTARPGLLRRLWSRELEHYPPTRARLLNLGLVVLITIVLYYQLYLIGAVSTHILRTFNMSFVWYVNMAVAGYVVGALASLSAGLADRYGRANIVVVGLLGAALLSLFGVPNAHTKLEFAAVFIAIGFIEGVCLVATPALIRDFSPQLGRASAMGFWTLGPVVGSLVVSLIVSNTSDTTPWQDQYIACGIVGLIVWLLALVRLRELAPRLRDQLMVSTQDRLLLEARAKGVDVEASLRNPFRQVLKLDVIGSAIAISVFLIIYYLAVGYFPVYFQTVFGFSQATANSLGNWFWGAQAIALLLTGFLSDKVRVRKPFMLVGAIGAIVFTSLFALRATQPHTSYATFAVLLSLVAVCLGVTYAPWMASFTETVERRNPAVIASGLAIWGLIIRCVIALSVFLLPHVITTVTTLVTDGPPVKAAAAGFDPKLTDAQNATVKAVAADPSIAAKVQALAARYAPQLATAAKLSDQTKAALSARPGDRAVQAQALADIAGLSLNDVVRVMTLNAVDAEQLATARAIDDTTRADLLASKADSAAQTKAVGEIAAAFGVGRAEASERLMALASLPATDLGFMAVHGPAVKAAVEDLTALGNVPAADLAFLNTWGKKLQDPTVQASLKFLQSHVPGLRKAAADSPRQWQKYFWFAVGGEALFIPLIFVMAGFWDPRKARRQEQEHEAWVRAEMARLDDRTLERV